MAERRESLEETLTRHEQELVDDGRNVDALASKELGLAEILAIDDIGHKAAARGSEWARKTQELSQRGAREDLQARAENLRREYEALAREVTEEMDKRIASSGESLLADAVSQLAQHVGRMEKGFDHAGIQGHFAQIIRFARILHGPDSYPDAAHARVADLLHQHLRGNSDANLASLHAHARRAGDHPHARHPGHGNPHIYA